MTTERYTPGNSVAAKLLRQKQLEEWVNSDFNRELTLRDHWQPAVNFEQSVTFYDACRQADTYEAERFLKDGEDVNSVNLNGRTVIHQVCIISAAFIF